jgi:DNA-binding NarL/FixJ family response regulator
MEIIIADDSALMRDRLAFMLAEIPGITVVAKALNVEDTVQKVKSHQPDMLVLDLRLLGGSGIDVLKQIKQDPRAPKVIVFTNYPQPQYRKAAYAAGADYFFHKSTEFEKLLETLRELCCPKSL